MLTLIRTVFSSISIFFQTLFMSPWRIFVAPTRWLVGMSVPGRGAALVVIFQLVCVVSMVILYFTHETPRAWNLVFGYKYWLPILGLMIVIPFVFYHMLRVWLEGTPSLYPDIDDAWKAGLQALERKGIRLDRTPLFLILGTDKEQSEKDLMNASRMEMLVEDAPQGQQALHWYADGDAVYLFCTRTSCLSKLATEAARIERSDGASAVTPSGAAPIAQTMAPGQLADMQKSVMFQNPGAPPTDQPKPNLQGTIMPGDMMMSSTFGPGLGASPRPVSILTDEELKEEKRRFTHVCQLLTRARRPLVSLNGILALIPFSLVEAGASGAVEITNAARGDLEAGAKALEVRCPVIVLFTGMEKQKGFRELVRRIGWESASEQRFGKGFHIWTTPTSQQMQALCSHACGQFERWIYNFFQQKDAPWNPGNRKLYALLCTIRQDLQQVLNSVLIGGFSQERDSANDHPFLISGCYFAATGKDEQSQAFVKAVFDRMIDQQASLEWTKEAIDNEKRYRGLARMGMLINVLLGLALVGLVITNFMPM